MPFVFIARQTCLLDTVCPYDCLVVDSYWNSAIWTFLLTQQSCGQGYVFTHVCDSVNRGVSRPGRPPTPTGRNPPSREEPPQTRQSPPTRQTNPPSTEEPPQTRQTTPHPRPGRPPPRNRHSGILSTSGRYASYWNAFLFYQLLLFVKIFNPALTKYKVRVKPSVI